MNAATEKILKMILTRVCTYLSVDKLTICGKSKAYDAMIARIIYAKLAHRWNITLTDIGKLINRNHSTIIRYLANYDDKYLYDKNFQHCADTVINHRKIKGDD